MNKVIYLLFLSLFLSAAEHAAAQQSPKVVSYKIDVKLSPEKKTVEGVETLTWTNAGATPTGELFFHLYLNAFKNSQSTFMLEAAQRPDGPSFYESVKNDGWGYCEVVSVVAASPGNFKETPLTPVYVQPDDDNAHDQTVMKLVLPKSVAPGESVVLNIEFISKLPHKGPRTGYHQNYFFVAQWLPKIGVWMDGEWNCHQFHANSEFFADYGEYDVSVTVPMEYVVGASGVLADSTAGDGQKTLRFRQDNIHDFAWTAWPNYKTAVRTFEHPDLPTVKMRLLYMPEHQKYVDAFFDATANTLKHFGLWYVAYPYPQITSVDAVWRSNSCGMEYPTLFTTCVDWLTPKGKQQPLGLTIHECGHQFFYGLIGTNEFENAWMDEGFTTYATSRCLFAAYGEGANTKIYLARQGFGIPFTLKNVPRDPRDWIVDNHRGRGALDFMDRFSWDYVNRYAYRNNAYEKPALMLWTLENYLGDAVFNKIMKTYAERNVFKHPKPQDFIDIVNEFAPQNMDWFFEKMLHQPGVVDVAVTKVVSTPAAALQGYTGHGDEMELIKAEEKKKDDDEVFESQVHVRRLGAISLPVELLVTFENGETIEKQWDGEAAYKIFYFSGK